MSLATRKRRSAARQMLDLARRRGDGGVALLPGVSQSGMHWLARDCGLGVSLTPTAGTLGPDSVTRPSAAWLAAYVESTASTPAAVDGPVGFLSDGEGTVGAELAPATLDFTTAAWYKGNGATAPSANVVNFPAVSAEVIQQGTGVNSANKSYFIRFTATGNGTLSVGVSNTVDYAPRTQLTLTGTPQTFTCKIDLNGTAVANAALSFCRLAGDTCTQATITAASWKQLTGRHATQNSGPNKPILRRGLVNGLAYSGDFSNAAWQKVGTSPAANAATAPDGTLTASVFTSTATGDAYIMQQVEGAGSTCFVGVFSKSGANQSDSVSFRCITLATAVEDDELLFNFTTKAFTGTGTIPGRFLNYGYVDLPNGNVLLYANNAAAAGQTSTQWRARPEVTGSGSVVGKTVGVWRGAIFSGTLTPDQILAAGGIPLTTTIAASSSGGNYALEFDGAVKNLSFTPPPITSACTLVIGVTMANLSGNYVLLGQVAGGARLYVTTAGGLVFDNNAAQQVASPNGLVQAGKYVVITARAQVGGTSVIRVNGVQVVASSALTNAFAGALMGIMSGNGGTSNFAPGQFSGGYISNQALSDAEVLVLERGLAALCPIPGALRF